MIDCRHIKTLIKCLLLLYLVGCAGPETALRPDGAAAKDTVRFWPPPPQRPRIEYLSAIYGPADIGITKSWFKRSLEAVFGKEDTDEGRMLRPYGVFADSGKVYVTDPGVHLLHVFDLKEKRYLRIGKANGEELISPIGIAADRNGEIYISDSMLNRVLVFDKAGSYLRDVGSKNLFTRPAGIAVDESRIYVVDTHAHRVMVFGKKDGNLLFSFGSNGSGKGEFNFPTNVFISRDSLLHVMDSMNFRVQIFGKEGNFVSSFGRPGDGPGDFSQSKGIAVDSEGHIYVADAHFDSVQIFNREGRILLNFGGNGRGPGDMTLPAGIFIDEKDRIYVADSYNNRVQIFQYLKELE